jgi:hypothetical protein
MELTLMLYLLLASTASGIAIEKRQTPSALSGLLSSFGASLQNMIAPSNKPIKYEDVKPRIRPTAKR